MTGSIERVGVEPAIERICGHVAEPAVIVARVVGAANVVVLKHPIRMGRRVASRLGMASV